MATTTLKILREVNDYTQEFLAEDVLNISQSTYARLEQNPSKMTAEHARKLADLYKISISNLLSGAAPVITFKHMTNNESNSIGTGIFQNNIYQTNESELTKAIQSQNELLLRQHAELIELVKVLSGRGR